MKNKKYVFGITLIIITFLLSLTIYYAIYIFPFFLTGVVLVWYSKTKKLYKVLWTIVPLLLIIPAVAIFQTVYEELRIAIAQKVDFNFPNRFQGKAVVVQNINCGQNIYIIEGREQLNFPENGILLYKGKIEDGFINHRYFYVNKSNIKINLPKINNFMYGRKKKNKLSYAEIGVWTAWNSLNSVTEIEFRKYTYFELIVASKKTKTKYNDFDYNKRLDSVKYQLIKNCK